MLPLLLQTGRDVDQFRMKPGRIKELQVVGIDGGLKAAAEGIAGQPHRQSTAMPEHRDFADQASQFNIKTVVLINRLEAGGSASRLIRLRLDGQTGKPLDASA